MTEAEIRDKEFQAILLFRQGKNKEVINLLQEIINTSDKNDKKIQTYIKETYYWLGKTYIRCNDFNAAKKNLEFYIANFKNFGENYEDAYYENAMMYYTEKKYQTAVDLFVKFLNEFPESTISAKVCYQIGESLYELSLYDDEIIVNLRDEINDRIATGKSIKSYLSDEIIEAVKEGKFHIYAVSTIDEGIEILTGVPAGKKNKQGEFPAGTVNYLVQEKLKKYYKNSIKKD
jgi:tetratricopeptide (TPR) repeat protein